MSKILEKEIDFEGKRIKYFLRKSKRVKNIKIEIKKTGEVFLVVPILVPNFLAERFFKSRIDWVVEKLKVMSGVSSINFGKRRIPDLSKKDFLKYGKDVEKIIRGRVDFFAKKNDFVYNKITIKNNKTNWGSCSSKGNLNFNYRLIFLKSEERDYIIVHELCHLKEMNHSKKFWAEVEKIIPNHKELRKNIKNIF